MSLDEQLLASIGELLDSLESTNIAHEDLGRLGFDEAQSTLGEMRQSVIDTMRRFDRYTSEVDEILAKDVLVQVRAQLKELLDLAQQVNSLAQHVTQAGDYSQRRERILKSFHNAHAKLRRTLHPLDSQLDLLDLRAQLIESQTPKGAEDARKEAEEILENARASADQIQAMLADSQRASTQRNVDIASVGFGNMLEKHQKFARWWFGGMCVFASLTIWAVIHILFVGEGPANYTESIVPYIFKKILMIAAPVAALKLCLSKFNLERNLQILYDHRQTVLDQYPAFDNAIADDDAKNQFRLEVAKFIFSDPATGYLAQKSGSELNINPVIGAVEKASRAPK